MICFEICKPESIRDVKKNKKSSTRRDLGGRGVVVKKKVKRMKFMDKVPLLGFRPENLE